MDICDIAMSNYSKQQRIMRCIYLDILCHLVKNDIIIRDAATCGTGIAFLSMTLELTPNFNGFVLLDLQFYAQYFVDYCLSFCLLSFGHYIGIFNLCFPHYWVSDISMTTSNLLMIDDTSNTGLKWLFHHRFRGMITDCGIRWTTNNNQMPLNILLKRTIMLLAN